MILQLFCNHAYKTKIKHRCKCLIFRAPPSEEMLNIWWDFRKVAEFIDLNRGWLLPLLDTVSSKNE